MRKTKPTSAHARTASTRIGKKSHSKKAHKHKHNDQVLAANLDAMLVREGILIGKQKPKEKEIKEEDEKMEVEVVQEKKKSAKVEELLDRLGGL